MVVSVKGQISRLLMVFTFCGVVGSLWGVAQAGTQSKSTVGPSAVLTGAEAKKLFKQCSRPDPQGVEGYWNLDAKTAQEITAVFPTYLKTQKLTPDDQQRDFSSYYRQYAGFLRKGRRWVYINAFAPTIEKGMRQPSPGQKPFNWKTQSVVACDGGRSFFGVEYEVGTRQFHELHFNGR